MLLKGCLHNGHSAFTLDHSTKQSKQNWWKQLSVKDLFSNFPKQIAQLGSGEAEPARLGETEEPVAPLSIAFVCWSELAKVNVSTFCDDVPGLSVSTEADVVDDVSEVVVLDFFTWSVEDRVEIDESARVLETKCL